MTSQIWLSVLIPTYNGANFLSTALDSIIIQEFSNIECIAIDDGSTDSTLSILRAYQDQLPIQIIQRERGNNWVANTNHALSVAQGEYICLLHQDDLWFAERLNTLKWLTESAPQAVLFLHPSHYVDLRGNCLGMWRCPLPSFPRTSKPDTMIEKLLIQNFIAIPAPVFKKEIAIRVGGMDEKAWYAADWDLWLKISSLGDTVYYPKALSGFRIHPSSQTVIRSSYLQDFRNQLETVADRHLTRWNVPNSRKKRVSKIARFSIDMNAALAGSLHGNDIGVVKLIMDFISLSPFGWHDYVVNSRVWERVIARLRANLLFS